LHWWLAQTLLSDVKVMTVSSAWMASLVAGRWPTHDIRVVPSAIGDGAGFWDVPPPMVSSPITYFFWGELSALKGPRLVIEAAARLRNLASDLTFRVWIGGSGSCGPELRALVRRLNLDSAVVLLGPLMVEEVIERLASTDVVTLPSAHEGFGMAILEAMAAGRPVITTSGGGGAELIRSRSEGITVPRTVEAITDAMLLLGRDAALRRSVGDAARRRARDFTWRRSVQLLLEAYEAALAQSDGGAR
jgi:D-inositol-3-phosphate glycosyltransferase